MKLRQSIADFDKFLDSRRSIAEVTDDMTGAAVLYKVLDYLGDSESWTGFEKMIPQVTLETLLTKWFMDVPRCEINTLKLLMQICWDLF